MTGDDTEDIPGFRRRMVVTPGAGIVRSAVEDDYHRMHVTVTHDAGIATAIRGVVERAPWTTCPGAAAELVRTFAGVALADFGRRGERRANCTHLHDLAVLAAAHAGGDAPVRYDIAASDAVAGRRRLTLARDGVAMLRWEEVAGRLVAPEPIRGLTLFTLGAWIAALPPEEREMARLLRWGAIAAHGRAIPLSRQSDARAMPAGACFTFQPARQATARRTGAIRDFSAGGPAPLD